MYYHNYLWKSSSKGTKLRFRHFLSLFTSIFDSDSDSSIELNEEGGGAVSPLGVVRHLRPAHRARPLLVEPLVEALLAEDVVAVEQGGAPVVVVADGTGAAGTRGLQLFGAGRSSETLK